MESEPAVERQRRRWESNPLQPGCSRWPGRLAPASRKRSMSSPGVEPGPRPSHGRVPPPHPEDCDAPPGSRTRPCGFEGRRASATLAGMPFCQESNLGFNRLNVACRPSHSKGPRDAEAAGAQGFEPCPSGLEPESSPRRTPLLGGHDAIPTSATRSRPGMCLTGLEPAPSASQAGMLPLHHRHSGRGGSRTRKAHRSPAFQAGPVAGSGGPSVRDPSGQCRARTCGLRRVMPALWPC